MAKTKSRRKAKNDNATRPKTVYDPKQRAGTVFRGEEQPTREMLARLIEGLDFSDMSGLPLALQKMEIAPGEHAYRKRDNLPGEWNSRVEEQSEQQHHG